MVALTLNGTDEEQIRGASLLSYPFHFVETAVLPFELSSLENLICIFLTFSSLSPTSTPPTQLLLNSSSASFHAFDKDRSGTLTKEELRLKIKTLLRSKKDGSPRTAEEIAAMETEVNKLLDDVFELIDTDKSGSIDIDEYVKGFAGNPQVIEFVENLRG